MISRLFQLTSRQMLLLVGIASAGILGGALIGQYFFDLYPCHLCIFQRWPHGVVIILAFAAIAFAPSEQYFRRILMLCCLILLIGAGIAGYHSGVEMGLIEGPDSCSAASPAGATLEDLRAEIAGAALVSCTQAMAYIFGLSMAVWNALLSLAIAAFVAAYLKAKP